MAVIIDNKPGEIVEQVIMVDDGTGSGIKIPSMLISKKDGRKILDQFEEWKEAEEDLDEDERGHKACVQLIGSFDLPHPDNRVEYDLWYSSEDEQAMDFLADFEEYHYRYKEHVYFTPRIFSFECKGWEEETLEKDCFSKGKYCAHSARARGALSGRDILTENLRQKCLHNKLQKNKKEKYWWAYIQYVHELCPDGITSSCSRKGMEEIEVKFEDIESCVGDSFSGGSRSSSENTILAKEAKEWKNNGPSFHPAVVINNEAYRGFLSADNVFEAICQGFKKHPSECKGVVGDSQDYNGISTEMMILIVVGILACNLVLLILYRRYYKQEMQNDVRMAAHSAVSQYFAIQNNDKEQMNLKAPGI